MQFSFLKSCLPDLRNVLLPSFCAGCGCRLVSPGHRLCASCLIRLPYISPRNFYDNPSARTFWGNIPIEYAHSYVHYGGDSSLSCRILALFKYHHRSDLGLYLGQLMARDLVPKGFFQDIDCILPVPLHWIRYLSRGYNQSYLLAQGISRVTGLPVLKDAVTRVRNNPSQTRLSGSERRENVQGIFQARSPLPYRHVLLIDDVLTTGSTLMSCARAIQQKNPEILFSALTFAKAQ